MARLQVLSIIGLVTVVMITSIPVQSSKAQDNDISVTTSADSFGGKFFGESILQIVVNDPDADNDGSIETVEVNIQAGPDVGSEASENFLIPETSDSSGRFEFFLTHADSDSVDPSDIDPISNQGVEGDGFCVESCAPIITFGTGADLDVDADLFEETEFEITVGNTVIDVHYDETLGMLSLDREHYPSTAYVYVFVTDQDANLNPTVRDSFIVSPDDVPNQDLFDLAGATILDEITFRETGDNTATFEARYRLGTTIDANSKSVTLTLNEKANYDATLDNAENDSNDTDEVNFTIGDTSGTISVGVHQTWDAIIATDKGSYKVGELINVTITDRDANVNSNGIDSIQLLISQSTDNENVSAFETTVNSGIFEISFSVTTDEDVVVYYTDPKPSDYSEKISNGENPSRDFKLEINIVSEAKPGIQATTVTPPIAKAIFTDIFSVGAHIELAVNITNNNDFEQDLIALIEVRDSNDVTIFLATQSGSIEANGSSKVGIGWAPAETGTFSVRTFTVSSLNGEILSPVSSSQLTVN